MCPLLGLWRPGVAFYLPEFSRAERAKELFDRETDPEGQLEKWLLFMIIDEFASVRTDENRQSHVSNRTSDPVYFATTWPISFEPMACNVRTTCQYMGNGASVRL